MKRCSVSVKLLIAALVWFAALMMPGEAGATTVRSGVSGDITWSIDGNGKLTLTGTGDYEGTYYSGPIWCEFGAEITSAEVNITDITRTDYMFFGCSELKNLDVRNLDTKQVTDMSHMFSGCSGLESLDVGSFDTAQVKWMSSMFSGCRGLRSLDLSSFDTGKVRTMDQMFMSCSSLRSLDVSSFDTAQVGRMDMMFDGCSSLGSLDVSSFNTAQVETMDGMFLNCSGLADLDISGFATGQVWNMGHMFYNCSSLTNLDVRGFATAQVTDMRYMFSGCSGLTRLDLSNFEVDKVLTMDSIFSGCSSLEILHTPVYVMTFGDAHSVRIPVEEKMGRKIMASYLGRSPEMQLFGAFPGIFLREKSFISSIVKSGLVTNASIIIIPFAIFHLQSLSETLFHAHYNNYAFPLVSYLLCDNNCILSICEYPQ